MNVFCTTCAISSPSRPSPGVVTAGRASPRPASASSSRSDCSIPMRGVPLPTSCGSAPARWPTSHGIDGAGVGALGREDGDGGRVPSRVGQFNGLPPVRGAQPVPDAPLVMWTDTCPDRRRENSAGRVPVKGSPPGLQVRRVFRVSAATVSYQGSGEELLDDAAGASSAMVVFDPGPWPRSGRRVGSLQRPSASASKAVAMSSRSRGRAPGRVTVQRRLLTCRESCGASSSSRSPS